MAKGSLKLNMKRDDARTLMLKMDARLTFAGRERHAVFELEGERELKHIAFTHQLINAELNRAKKDVQRRSDFYRTLMEKNKERREKRDTAWCEEEEKEWEREARAARRRQRMPKIEPLKNHKAEAINSIRRDQKREFANMMTHEMLLNRSLDALNETFAKRKTLETLDPTVDESGGGSPEGKISQTAETDSVGKLSTIKLDEGQGKLPKAIHKPSLPEILAGKCELYTTQQQSGGKPDGAQGSVLHESRLVVGPTTRQGQTFYMNTSTCQRHAGSVSLQERLAAFTPSRPVVHPERPAPVANPHKPTTKRSTASLISLGPQQKVPLRFYENEKNPFLTDEALPAINRSNALVEADKADEMFGWLGFESKEEFDKLREDGSVLDGVIDTDGESEGSYVDNDNA